MGSPTSMHHQKAARLIRHALDNLTLRETLVVGGWSEQEIDDAATLAETALMNWRFAPVAVPPPGCGHTDPVEECWHCRGVALAAGRPVPTRRRPIERYVRATVEIPGSKGRIDGSIEIGLHRERHEQPSWYRNALIEVGEVAVRLLRGRPLDEDTADEITEDLDARIVGLWGDRPRFIEIWRGTGTAEEALSQVYAPHGMPIARKA